MSTVLEKRTLAQAEQDARDFRNMFEGCFDHWQIAGSVRRKKSEIGDVEHVVVPKITAVGNLLWHRLDANTSDPGNMFGPADVVFQRHVYPNAQHRWGPKYRGVDFRGFNHEIFLADGRNFGAILAIRTGPAEYSKMLVTALLKSGRLRQQDGYVRWTNGGSIYPMPTERDFFTACHVPWIAPERRG